MNTRLRQQIDFIMEMDRLKAVLRQNKTPSAQRRENTAEHSWHLAIMGLVLEDQSPTPVDRAKVLCMLLLHDVVEIDAGDTFAYDESGHAEKADREKRAADRLFGLLPNDQEDELRSIWDEFEAGTSAEARLARALDRLQPILMNHRSGAMSSWAKHGISKDQVLSRNREVEALSPALWALLNRCCNEAIADGFLRP
jgi:putative hydrolase of HD superfamily